MRNLDHITDEQTRIANEIVTAANNGDSEAFEAGLQNLFQNISDSIMESAASVQNNADAAALAQRGVRVLTSAEEKFYNTIADAIRSNPTRPFDALTGADVTFPVTIIDAALEDMQQNHPLLAAIDMVNTTGLTRFITNTDEGQGAAWGEITAAIEKEIASGFKDVEIGQFKLSAFIPVDLAMLDLGAAWLDSYVRTCLSEALAIGYENAIVSGTGKNQPIGMDRSVADNVTVTGGVYPQKSAIAVTDLTPASYGDLVAKLAKTPNGKVRQNMTDLVLVVNPVDNYKTIMPATTVLTAAGTYANDVLPVPTQVIPSVAVKEGEAILGLAKRYFLGTGGSRGVQFSDDYKFLEDKRYYKVVAYANGLPKDNNAFLRLDISKLAPSYITVKEVQ